MMGKKSSVPLKARINASNVSLEDIVEVLRTRIVNQELHPGFKLSEAMLTEEFKVSRPRIREAFGVLEDRGLIERIPNRGAIVSRLEEKEILSLFEVREVLEALAVRLATEKSAPGAWKELSKNFGFPAKQAIKLGNLDFYVDCINSFRLAAIAGADNPVLAAQMEALFDRTRVLIRRLVLVPGRAEAGRQQHQEILEAMVAGDSEQAERLKRNNIRSSRETFIHYRSFLI